MMKNLKFNAGIKQFTATTRNQNIIQTRIRFVNDIKKIKKAIKEIVKTVWQIETK